MGRTIRCGRVDGVRWWGLACALVVAGALIGPAASAQEGEVDLSAWKASQQIVVKLDGITMEEDVSDFPLAIRLSQSANPNLDFQNDKNSLRFTTTETVEVDGEESETTRLLDYEIESWDVSTRTAVVWVKVDLAKDATQKEITMHWYNPDAEPVSSGADVFHENQGFRGVYHLADGEGGSFADASSMGRDGVGHVQATGKLGVVGRGQEITKQGGDYIEVAEPEGRKVRAYTLSAWVRQKKVYHDWDNNVHQWIAGCFDYWVGEQKHLPEAVGPSGYGLAMYGTQMISLVGAMGQNWNYRTGAFGEGDTWYHAAVSWDAQSGQMTFYLNGAQYKEPTALEVDSIPCAPNYPFRIGAKPKPGSSVRMGIDGYVDEVREETLARTPTWIKLCYENQKPGSQMVQFGQSLVSGDFPLSGGRVAGDIEIGSHRITSTNGEVKSLLEFTHNEGGGSRTLRLQAADGPDAMEAGYTELNVVPGQGVVIQGTHLCDLDVQGQVKGNSMGFETMARSLNVGANRLTSNGANSASYLQLGSDVSGALVSDCELFASSGSGADMEWMNLAVRSDGMYLTGRECVLDVQGEVKAEEVNAKSVRINDWRLTQKVPDYVFGVYDSTSGGYELQPLSELETYVREHRHLPGIESAESIGEKGLDMVEMQLGLLRHVEETVLRLIDMEKTVEAQRAEIAELRDRLDRVDEQQ